MTKESATNNPLLRVVEILVLGGIVLAFIVPAFMPSSESEQPQTKRSNGAIASVASQFN